MRNKPLANVSIELSKDLDTILKINAILEDDPSEAETSNFADWVAHWDDVTFIVAKLGEKVIGFCILVDDEVAPLLDVLFVVQQYRNQNIGARLVEQAKRVHNKLTLIADDENAIRFYERNGFKNKGLVYHMLGYGEHATAFTYGELE